MSQRPSWRDHRDRPVSVTPVPGPDAPAFYVPIGAFQRGDYARNAFTRGTDEELATLRALLPLRSGARVLDVGCGDARHLRAAVLADAIVGVGVDVSPELIEAGRAAAAEDGIHVDLRVGDARELSAVLGPAEGTFDVAWSLCQGGLGTSPASDPGIVEGLAQAVRPGGTVVLTLFHALFAARHLAPGDAFDPVWLVHHQRSEVRGPDHARAEFDLWTASYTVREATGLVAAAGLELRDVRGVEPGGYGRRAAGEVGLDDPELLLVADRPPAP